MDLDWPLWLWGFESGCVLCLMGLVVGIFTATVGMPLLLGGLGLMAFSLLLAVIEA